MSNIKSVMDEGMHDSILELLQDFIWQHVKIVQKVKFQAIYDVDVKNAERIAKAYKLEPFKDLSALLESDLDVVLVAVPHSLHTEMVIAIAEAGKIIHRSFTKMTLESSL
jgi:predicted dehydrogenase